MLMNPTSAACLDGVSVEPQPWEAPAPAAPPHRNGVVPGPHSPSRDMDLLRRCAWEIGEKKCADGYHSPVNHVGLAMVSPAHGFAHWHVLQPWVDRTAWHKGNSWHHCRLILRLYDVSNILFNGLNAHRIQDEPLPALSGQQFFKLPRAGTWQLAEVGFLLRNGEFVPAARSYAAAFAPDGASSRGEHTALHVDGRGRVEEIGNLWDQEKILRERRQPKLRTPLRIGAFALASLPSGQQGSSARFVSELAAGQVAQGHEVHVFVPASDGLRLPRQLDGVYYQPVDLPCDENPLAVARAFGRAVEQRLRDLPPFDVYHCHEWMTGLVPSLGDRPTVLSLSSIETTRLNGNAPGPLSGQIQQAERELAQTAGCLLTPDWLREKAVAEFGVDGARVHAFAMEGRMPNEWECPLDYGHVKMGIGVGPLDRLLLFVGPLEHAAGPDLLLEALPVALQRVSNLRLAFIGTGNSHGHLEHRARQLGVAHAVRVLGHVEGPQVTRLLRAAEALVLPSRYRVPFDDAVVDLARRAGRPVITTHGGPAHLVRHEETGVITYDNPGSMVWAMDRILGDPSHAEQMGRNGRRSDGSVLSWSQVTRHYLDLCAATFPELTEIQG